MTAQPQRQRIYAGIVSAIVFPLAARALKRRVEYSYDPNNKVGRFHGSRREKCYSPEACNVYPMGNGSALLQAEGDDSSREWMVAGVPELDSFGWGQQLESGEELGTLGDDLAMSLDVTPRNGGEKRAVNPLPVLQTLKAGFVDAGAARPFEERRQEREPIRRRDDPSSEITVAEDNPPAQQQQAVDNALEIFKSKPQFTAAQLAIGVGIGVVLSGLVVYGLTRR